MRKSTKLLVLISILIIAITVVGCSSSKPDEQKIVNVGLLKLTSSAPIFIGIEKGFFKEQGLEIKPEWFEAAQPIAVATASNKIHVGASGITASLFNMAAAGQPVVIVSDKGREYQGYNSSALIIRNDLWDNGIRKIEDLKGKKIGITQSGSTFHYMIGRMLELKGMSLTDVEIVTLGKVGSLTAALEGKQVDAVILNEPNVSKAVNDGTGKVLVNVGDVMDYQVSGIFFSPQFAEDKETAIKFMKGYIKSTRFYYDNLLVKKEDKVLPGPHYDEVIEIIAKYTGAPKEDIKKGIPYIDRDGKLLEDDIKVQIDWYYAHKMIDTYLNVDKIVNIHAWEEALKQLK